MHIPVLLNEVLTYLEPKPGDNVIDCTIGEGGHAFTILRLVAPHGRVLGIDRDAEMIKKSPSERLILHHGNFSDITEIARRYNFSPVNGILFDFGLSSWQLEESGAGFSFQNNEPLDMRFDRTKNAETAASILNSWPEASISRIIYEFGEERFARRIAKEVVQARKKDRITTTDQLVEIISRVVLRKSREIHFATRTFQALRIAVNNELINIEAGLKAAINLLSPGGRICAISFHSLEDRRVKNIFREYSKVERCPPSFLDKFGAEEGKGSSSLAGLEPSLVGSLRILTKKPITPSEEEIDLNPRARSGKLRAAEKIEV